VTRFLWNRHHVGWFVTNLAKDGINGLFDTTFYWGGEGGGEHKKMGCTHNCIFKLISLSRFIDQ